MFNLYNNSCLVGEFLLDGILLTYTCLDIFIVRKLID